MKQTILWTALITPMHEDGSIHEENLKSLIHRQDKAGNGVLILGSTGEGLALSEDDKRKVISIASSMKLSVPLMVGIGGFNLSAQKELMDYCKAFNVDSYLLVTPLYAKPGPEGQYEWFKALLDHSGKPCMLYNVPSRTALKMSPVVLGRLKDHPKLWAVKEASGSISEYQQFREVAPEIPLFSGDDALTAFFATAGCSGLVSVASNVWPEETNLYTKMCLEGKTDTLFPTWNHAVEALFSASNPVPSKVLLKEKGEIDHVTLRSPLSAADLKSKDHLLAADVAIKKWYSINK
jgi:4-hydroxy-tetrahydrodipicolinate synthase